MRILFVLLPFLSLGQRAEIDFDYTWADITTIDASKVANDKQEMQVTFYADSIPLKEWFKNNDDYKKEIVREDVIDSNTTAFLKNDGKFYTLLFVSYPWAKDFPVSDYRVLSIYNPSNYVKRLYHYCDYYKSDKVGIEYYVEKFACALQAKDESGSWKDITQMHRFNEQARINIDSGYMFDNMNPKKFIDP